MFPKQFTPPSVSLKGLILGWEKKGQEDGVHINATVKK